MSKLWSGGGDVLSFSLKQMEGCLMVRILLISFMVVFVVACTSTYGKPITEEQIASLQQGVTTEQELKATMGKPIASSVNSDGTKIYSWAYSVVGLGVYENKALTAIFGADGLLQSFTVSDVCH